MSNISLTAEYPLKGYARNFGSATVRELQDLSIYSVSQSLQADKTIKAVEDTFATNWPKTGHSSVSSSGEFRVLGLQSDQVFVLQQHATGERPSGNEPTLNEHSYVTDQSDSWVGLEVKGPTARAALERICPIDLHPSVFGAGAVTRTSMEHLAAIVLCIDADHYWLLSPTSSAQSFLHAVETSFYNVSA